MMIDWKDVNKELPKNLTLVLVCICPINKKRKKFKTYFTSMFYNSHIDYKKGIETLSNEFELYHSNAFENPCFTENNNYMNGSFKLTHWAYINKPENKD